MKKRPFLVVSGTVIGTVGVLSYVPGATTASPLLALSSATQSSTSQSSTPQAPTSTSTQSTPRSEEKATTKVRAKATAKARAKARAKAKAKALTTTSTQAPAQTATHAPTPTPAPAPATSTRKINGSTFQTPFGPVQVQITVEGTKIIGATALQAPQGGRSSWINQQAVPYLIQETLAAQSANIQGVGGATYTSEGWAQSLQAAISKI